MRKIVLAVAAGAALGFASACFAMGGMGGGGMSGGGMGGYGSGMRSSGFDDYATAVRLIHHEKYAEAIPYLNRALQQGPSADVLNYLGYTHRMLGDYPGSLDFYSRALARNPDHKGAHEYLGELYLKMNQLDNANAQLAELTRLCPDGCEEKDVLTKAISDYRLAAATPAPTVAQPAATTAPAATSAPTTTQPVSSP